MTKDTAGKIRARRILNDKILSARVQVAVNKKLGIKTPDHIGALAKLSVPKGPIELQERVSKRPITVKTGDDPQAFLRDVELQILDNEQYIGILRQGEARKGHATA